MNSQLRKIETPHNEITHNQKNPEQTLAQKQNVNQESLKGIMNGEKTALPSLRNIEWGTETNKINKVLPYILTNYLTELNELIYAGAKLVCEKIGIPSKSTKKKSKPGWEIRLETLIKNLKNQAKLIK